MIESAEVRLQREDFNAAAEVAALMNGQSEAGAVVTFTGVCRASEAGRPIRALTLEHYPGMAEAEISRHVEEARTRWQLIGTKVIHRYGRLEPGQNIVLVIAVARHRGEAFAAAEFLIDYLKTHAPFWKQVEYGDARAWVAAKEADTEAASRWTMEPSGPSRAAE